MDQLKMQNFICSTILILGFQLPFIVDAASSSDMGGWFVPQKDGSSVWMTEEEYDDFKAKHAFHTLDTEIDIKYWLFTPQNPNQERQIFEDENSISKSFFDKKLPTRFIIHGWLNGRFSPVNELIRTAFLKTGDYNVITVDWTERSVKLAYPLARGSVPQVGLQVARFIDLLVSKGLMNLDTVHLIGHSLGAHVAGFAGKYLKSGKIPKITGLDPALPLFGYKRLDLRLATTDAIYVESIQTCGNYLGFLEPIGHAAFYPNGGKAQPGCGWDLAGGCAHGRAYEYYAESIEFNDFVCTKCGSFEDATRKLCGGEFEKNIKMGSPKNPGLAEGSFFVPVNDKAPFGRGDKSGFTALALITAAKKITKECSGAANKLIFLELKTATTFLSMGSYFSLSSVNLENLSHFFFLAATKVYEDAGDLAEFLSKENNFIKDLSEQYKNVYHHSEKREWKDGVSVLTDALGIETKITGTIREMLRACKDSRSNSTSAFLETQLENEQTILTHIRSLKAMASTNSLFNEFLYDKEL